MYTYDKIPQYVYRIAPILVLVWLIVTSCTRGKNPEVTTEELQDHIKYLSSDSLKGRETGTPGDSLASDYIRGQLASAGLIPLTGDGFQRYRVTHKVVPGKMNFFSLNSIDYRPDKDFTPFSFSGNSELESDVVFAGYGFNISNDSLKWNDYENLDVKGKWVLILMGDPEPDKTVSGFIPFAGDRDKALLAKDMGAAGVLLVSGPGLDAEDKFESLSSSDYSVEIPVLRIKRELADQILKNAKTTVSDLENRLIKTRKPYCFKSGEIVRAGSDVERESSETRNVIMMLPGEDEKLKNEYVIIGAHLDHLGTGGPGSSSRAVDTIAVHHGADDNASGVGEMIELAEKFALTKGSHARSMVFAAFSGEEMGLLGSKYFTENPGIDLTKVNAMINLDMIGRLQDSTSLQVGGVGTAEGLRDLVLNLDRYKPDTTHLF